MAAEAPPATTRARQIGAAVTLARILVGVALVGSVVAGHLRAFHPLPWLVGVVVLPGLMLGWQKVRARRSLGRLRATWPMVHLANLAVFLALYLTPYHAPTLAFTSDAALLFYGTSMLLAADMRLRRLRSTGHRQLAAAPQRPDRLPAVPARRQHRKPSTQATG